MKIGDKCKVQLNYAIRLNDGQIVEKNEAERPLEFTTGKNEVIPALEKGIMGMEPGQSKTFDAGPEEAFGKRDPEAVRIINRNDLENRGEDLDEGLIFKIKDEDDHNLIITVLSKDEDEIILDLNHPLAGSTLTFDVEILEVSQV